MLVGTKPRVSAPVNWMCLSLYIHQQIRFKMGSLLTLRVPSTGSNSVDISLFSAACCLEGMNLSLKRTGDVSFIDKFDFAPFYNGTVTNRIN